MRNLIFTALILVFTADFFAQDIIYSDFSLTEIDSKVSISWVIDSGSICQGVKLEHSLDGINFEVIDEIIGVCGSSGEAKSYNLIDQEPERNTLNYYRLVFGISQRSEVLSIYVRYVIPGEIQIFPMPAVSNFKIYFSNSAHALTSLKIFNEAGNVVFARAAISDDFIELTKSEFVEGIYFVRFESENQQESIGKLIIQ